jgi:3D (Asp-Asp-Asp) domain-containing protein
LIKSIFIGSTTCVLLAVSVISYSRPFAQSQNPSKQGSQPQIQNPVTPENSALASDSASAESLRAGAVNEANAVKSLSAAGKGPAISSEDTARTSGETLRAAETYMATAYSLRGRTASGQYVARGLIAADPRVLPLGTRVRLEAGPMSGEYLVADTGGAVRGRHVDIWIPSTRDAMRFGRRAVKLTILSYGPRKIRAKKAGAEVRGKANLTSSQRQPL